uniref:Mastin-like n=1 Tax=Theropithecus gelada TaxID=9565 RepID=A0A8D2EKI2_THEGE
GLGNACGSLCLLHLCLQLQPGVGRELVGIVGGCDVSARRYPWQVSLRFYSMEKGLWEHICGGSLIHPEWVLTAAHCLEPLYEDDQPMKVVEIVRHPRYNKSLSAQGGADIALLKLDAPVLLSELVHPVSLPPASLDVPSGKTCWVTGWGDIGRGEPLPWPLSLREVRVKVRSNVLCNQIYCRRFPSNHTEPSEQLIKDDMLCAGDGNHGSCVGDTGGPLVCRWNCTWVQVGVVSWGTFCGHSDVPGVYARVMSYMSWIHQPRLPCGHPPVLWGLILAGTSLLLPSPLPSPSSLATVCPGPGLRFQLDKVLVSTAGGRELCPQTAWVRCRRQWGRL